MPKNPAPWQKLARVNAHPRDARIEFDEPTHTYYIDGDSTNIMSTTTFIHSFFGHFDPDAIIAKMMNSPKWQQSKYYGMTPEQIKKLWSDNGANASGSGTAMHLAIEQYYNEAYDEIDPAIYETTEWKYFMKFYKKYGERYKMYRSEHEVFSDDLRLSGSIDCVFQRDDGKFCLGDWKRSKEIKFNNSFQKGYGPCAILDDCNVNHYGLQLNIYKWYLETYYDMKIEEMFLIIIHPDNKSYQRIMISDDYGPIVQEMLECRRKAVQGGFVVPIDFSDYPIHQRPPQKHH